MQAASAAFKAKLAGPQRQPGIEIAVDGWPYVIIYGKGWTLSGGQATPRAIVFGDPLGLTFGDTNPDDGTTLVFGDTVLDTSSSVDVLHNVLEISSFECQVSPTKRVPNIPNMEIKLSKGGVLDDAPDPTGRAVAVRYSLGGNEVGDIATLFAGTVKAWEADEEGITYTMILQHHTQLLTKEICGNPKSQLASDMADTDTSCSLLVGGAFPSFGTLQIGDECVRYTGRTGNTVTGLSRGTLSPANEHSAKDEVSLCLYFGGGGLTLQTALLHILSSTGAGTNGAYDTLHEAHGCAYPSEYIDIASFIGYDSPDANDNQTLFDLIYWEAKPATEIIEGILAALNAFLIIRNDGMLSLVADSVPAAGDVTLTESNLLSRATAKHGPIINRIEWKGAAAPNSNWKQSTHHVADSPSIAKHGEKLYRWDVPVIAAWTGANGAGDWKQDPDNPPEDDLDPRYEHFLNAAQWMVQKYRDPSEMYQFKCPFSILLTELGDRIAYGKRDGTTIYPLCSGRNVDVTAWTINLTGIKKS